MGVTLPVSFPSIDTFAPAGNEVTFNLPRLPCAEAVLGSSSSVPTNTNIQAIRECWFMEFLLVCFRRSTVRPTRVPHVLAGGDIATLTQLPLHAANAPKPFCFNEKEGSFRWLGSRAL
jgi:hypothetical protein